MQIIKSTAIIAILVVIVLYYLPLTGINERGSIFVSGLAGLLGTFWIFFGLLNESSALMIYEDYTFCLLSLIICCIGIAKRSSSYK